MTKKKQFFALTFAAALALTGCSSSPSDSSDDTTQNSPAATEAAAATGSEATGPGYTFNAPEGWEVQPEDMIPGVDVVVMGEVDAVGFAENINALQTPAEDTMTEEFESAAVKQLEAVGNTDVVVRDTVTVAEVETVRVTSKGSQEGVDYHTDQFFLTSDGKTNIVTFTFNISRSDAEMDEFAMSVLNTWSWN